MAEQNTPLETLDRVFGYSSFRPGQEELVTALLEGRDALGIMPTGGGKSICYQLPALLLPGITLVISPLIALMQDQVRGLVELGVRGAYLNTSLTPRQLAKATDNACMGMYKIIYLAPERLKTEGVRRLAESQPISMVCVDEAHCVSQWGQDFRPGYLQIRSFIESLPVRPTVAAFTATATPKVRSDIVDLLGLQSPAAVTTGFDRPNLYFEVQHPKDKFDALVACLERHQKQSGIIYCLTRKDTEEVAERLCHLGYEAGHYHGGMDAEERKQMQEDFLYDRKPIMVATNAFGMGIDKSNVSFVIHYNMPRDPESYYQEAGRAGRDGSPADCILFYADRDYRINEYLINQDPENETMDPKTRQFLRKQALVRLGKMSSYSRGDTCLRGYLLRYFGEKAPEKCGGCSVCRGVERLERVRSRYSRLEPMDGIRFPSGETEDDFFPRTGREMPLSDSQQVLYGKLQEVRMKQARRYGVPPFNILTDASLREMARRMPKTETELVQIPGMTARKVKRYGRGYLQAISEHCG